MKSNLLTQPFASLTWIIMLFCLFSSCKKEDISPDPPQVPVSCLGLPNGTQIDTVGCSIAISNDTIRIGVPSGADIKQLLNEIKINGFGISFPDDWKLVLPLPITFTISLGHTNTCKYVVNIYEKPFPLIRNTVFVGGRWDNTFYSLDAVTGHMKWKFTGTQSFYNSSPAIKDMLIYAGSLDGYLYAFNAIIGVVVWKFKTFEAIESPATVEGNTLYVGSNDGNLYALDATTGALKWKYYSNGHLSGSPVVVNGVVYFCSGYTMYALDASTGQLKWWFQTGGDLYKSGPSVVNGVVYVGSNDYFLYAFDATTGALKWKCYTGFSLYMSSPTVANGIVYIGGGVNWATRWAGGVYAVNASTGALVWESLRISGVSGSPIIANGLLYVSTDDGYFNVLNATNGMEVWKKQIFGEGASPTVANGVVYVGGGRFGYFYAFNAITGEEKWKSPIPQSYWMSGPLVVDDAGIAHYSGESGAVQ